MKTFVIGDLHGAARALTQVLERSAFDFQQDTLIVLGDICDGWSEVKECIDILLTINNLVVLKGNHDAWYLENFAFYHKFIADHPLRHLNPNWLYHGGQSTIDSIGFERGKYYEFLNDAELLYNDDDNNLFVHAGGWCIGKETIEKYADQYSILAPFGNQLVVKQLENIFLWSRADLDKFQTEPYTIPDFNHVFIGHTPTIMAPNFSDTPVIINNLVQLDTGAAFTGRLSIMDVNTKQFFTSDIVKDLYPNERGRN